MEKVIDVITFNCDRIFVYAPKKVIVRGLGMLKPQKQLDSPIDWLGTIHKAFSELELV